MLYDPAKSSRSTAHRWRRYQRQFKLPKNVTVRHIFTGLLWIAAILAAVLEFVLLFRANVAPPSADYDHNANTDYDEEVAPEDNECTAIFNLIDIIQDELLTLQEFEAFALYRFRGHALIGELDAKGIVEAPGNTVGKSIIPDELLEGFDLNGDKILTDDELTAENVKVLFDTVKEAMDRMDQDSNQLVTWPEFQAAFALA